MIIFLQVLIEIFIFQSIKAFGNLIIILQKEVIEFICMGSFIKKWHQFKQIKFCNFIVVIGVQNIKE